MPMQEPLNPEDLIVEPQEVLEMHGYEFSEEELAELDRRDTEALHDLATSRLRNLEDVLLELNEPRRTRLAG